MPETLAFFAQIEELARTLLAATPEVGKKLFWEVKTLFRLC